VSTSVLLSIKPKYAEAIFDGSKRFEFRRAVFRRLSVQRVVVYASAPVCRVIGEFTIGRVLSLELKALWGRTAHAAGIDKRTFDHYFEGKTIGYAIAVSSPRRFENPIELQGGFGIERPPQSFQYLN
jgi:predicted transcriptional regulator